MLKEFIEVGQIVNTHGVRGECKLHPLGFTADFAAGFRTFYIDGKAWETTSRRIHGSDVLVSFAGIADMNAALSLKGKAVFFRRADAETEPNVFFDEELLGLQVADENGTRVGELTEVLAYPAHDVYRVVQKETGKSYLIPAVPDVFIMKVDMEENRMTVKMMKGLATDEN